jgi:dephospho-CoA kinase
MLHVGLTGNIASGKSTVAAAWSRSGGWIVDADELARRAVAPGTPGLAQVVESFGTDVLGADGRLDRAALRRVVFADPAARRRLEAIVHPEVARLRAGEVARAAAAGARIVVHDIPLLFEAGLERTVEVIVLVDAPEPVRRARLVRDRGLGEEEAERMIVAQAPSSGKRALADYVIENDASLEALEARAAAVWLELERRAEHGGAAGAAGGAGGTA